MKTLYLSTELDEADFFNVERAVGHPMSQVLSDTPAINIHTWDNQIVEDAVYWLGVAGVEVIEIA